MAFKLLFPKTKYRDVRGRVLRFASGVVGVPVEYTGDGWWNVIVVGGDHPSYPVGGHGICVSVQDIDSAERVIL